MHCFKYSAKEISSFSILFCEGDSGQRAVQQACKESAKFFSAPWHAGSRPVAPRAVRDVALHMGGGCNVPVSVLFNMSYCTLERVHLARDRPGEPRSLFTTDLTREVRPREAV